MIPTSTRQWLIAELPIGRHVKATDFKLVETPLPPVGPNQLLVRVLYLSFAPSQRLQIVNGVPYAPPVKPGDPMRGGGLAQVLQSNSPDFAPGDIVNGSFGWSEYAVIAADKSPFPGFGGVQKADRRIPLTTNLGAVSGNGLTAYVGMFEVGKPAPGDTVVVSGAAGSVGMVAGQLAKISGCHVVGVAGGPEKCAWLKELGFDAAIDYKAGDLAQQIKSACPRGVDVFYDNVGGEILDVVLGQLAHGARIIICGGISRYESVGGATALTGPGNYFELINKKARMEGFLVFHYADKIPEAKRRLVEWVRSGKLIAREDVIEGFENAPQGLIRLFEGKNFGQQILKIADPS